MTRTKGIIPFSGNFEVQAAAPLDARLRVETRADLLLANSWEALDGSPYAYEGMPVAVWNDTTAENNGIYILQDTDFTDINNWLQVSGSGGSGGTASWDGVYQTPTGTQVQVDGSLQDWVNIHFPSMVQTITISAIPSFGLREFGDDVTNPQIIGNSGLGSNPAGSLTLMEWWRGAEGGTELNPDEANPTSSTNYTRTDTFTVSTNQSYTVKSTDDQTRTDTASGGYSFVFPFYWGVVDENTDIFDGITQAQILAITGMGKYVQTSGTKAVTTNPTNEQFCIMYPAGYGALTSVIDNSGFETISDYNTYTYDVVGLDTTSQSYRVYILKNDTTQVNFTNTYYF